jgi:multidrug efflux pump subunit AcrA (membrane-fusion protein)
VQRDADIIEAPADKASELVAAAKQYDLARALIKKNQAEQDAAKAFLQAHIRDHQGLSLPGYRATWAQNKPSDVVQWEQVACQLAVELDRAGVKDAALKYAELEAQYTTRKPGARVFRLITAEGA